MAGKKKSNSRRKPSVEFWLLTLTRNQVLKLVMLKTSLRKKKTNRRRQQQQQQQQQASAVDKRQAATRGGGLPTWGLPQGRNTYIHLLLVQQKVWKKVTLHTSTKTVSHSLCWCCFSQKFFICWWIRPTYTTNNTQTDKQGLATDCLTLRSWTWWISLP